MGNTVLRSYKLFISTIFYTIIMAQSWLSANESTTEAASAFISQDSPNFISYLEGAVQGLSPEDTKILLEKLNVTDIQNIYALLENARTISFDEMYVKAMEDQLIVYHDFRVHKFLLLYIPPILLVLGTFGNVFSFIILTRRVMRKVSSYIYLAVLSVTDTLVLYVGLLRLWIGELTRHDIRDHSDWICKTINVLGYTVSDYSVWLIIAVTVERYIAVCHALRAPSMCNRSRAAKVIAIIGAMIFVINIHFFFTTEIHVSPVEEGVKKVGQCNPAKGFEKFIKGWHWVDACIYSVFPFIILSILNGLIITKVLIAKQIRTGLSEASRNPFRTAPVRSPGRSHSEGSTRLTIMLLTISFAFVLTTLPMNINLILTFYWSSKAEGLEQDEKFKLIAQAALVRTITEILMYTNHSMNFFLYCATGQKFRQQLFALLCRKRWPVNGQHSLAQTDVSQLYKTNYGEMTRNCHANHQIHGSCTDIKYCPVQDSRKYS